ADERYHRWRLDDDDAGRNDDGEWPLDGRRPVNGPRPRPGAPALSRPRPPVWRVTPRWGDGGLRRWLGPVPPWHDRIRGHRETFDSCWRGKHCRGLGSLRRRGMTSLNHYRPLPVRIANVHWSRFAGTREGGLCHAGPPHGGATVDGRASRPGARHDIP